MAIYGNNIDLYRDYLMLNEAYIGKTPTLLEIEKKIGEARKKIKYMNANNTLKEVLEVNRLFEKQYGMDIFALQIYPTSTPNAYTQVLAANFDIAEEVVLHDKITGDITNGYKFKPNNNFCILINIASSIMMDNNYTDEEIVAILLHELGHNFADCIYDDIEIANRAMMQSYKSFLISIIILETLMIITIPLALINLKTLKGKTFNNEKKNANQQKSQKPGKGKLRSFFAGLKGKITDVNDFINAVINRLFGAAVLKRNMRYADIEGVPEKVRKSIGRQNEVIADKFAGIYGYGPAQVSALIKLDSYKSKAYYAANKINPKANNKFEEIINRLPNYDVHPHTIQRARSELTLLQNELSKEDLDPKVKKVLQAQVKEILDLINELTKTSDKFSKSENAKRVYNAYINNECPDALDKEIEDKIEDALDKALNDKRKRKKK